MVKGLNILVGNDIPLSEEQGQSHGETTGAGSIVMKEEG